ncbi:hypothetical protein JAAARDRAFT_506948 [Jaapia argillacea MUCL 33604]|uniref:FAD-binding PCMH-type domain-containing protein n=1 Tax=Jaapia argillacea MUCL 33604 TaxID=933084 RepID=A0A067Q5D3_9AGAM|nr:hypothetical protein JAAARDRAFT_506948 [Jaapia argillacea MUCL 33604]
MSQKQELMSQELSDAIDELESICDAPGSKSDYFNWGSSGYKDSIRHFLASSSQVAQLAVQPGSVDDLGKMMKVLRKYQVPFAVKGGGHGMAPTFSSTIGIQISMSRFSKVRFDKETQHVEIGAGCLWDQVYSKLASTGRNVIGGAASDGVGVAGWLLGGGYSLKSNCHGLGIDNVVSYEIVTPDGCVRTVNANKERELFQALRGGASNFGIVTKFVLQTFAQNLTYGAYLLVPGTREEEVKDALVEFIDNETRKEACVIAAFRHKLDPGESLPEYTISAFCVYDAEKPKRNVPFQEFVRLAQSGEVWKLDPAGWTLGQTELPSSNAPMKHFPTTSIRRPFKDLEVRGPGQFAIEKEGIDRESLASASAIQDSSPYAIQVDGLCAADEVEVANQAVVSAVPQDQFFTLQDGALLVAHVENLSVLHNEEVEDDGGPLDDIFEEMSYDRWYGISSRQPTRYSNGVRSGDNDMDHDTNSIHEDKVGDVFNGHDGTLNVDFESDGGDSDRSLAKTFEPSLICHSEVYELQERDLTETLNRKDTSDSNVGDHPRRILVTKNVDNMGEIPQRGRFGCLMVSKYTKPLLDKMADEAKNAAGFLKSHRGSSIIVDAWPVHKTIFENSPPGAAFPHKREAPYGPLLVYFRWNDASDDVFWIKELEGTLERIRVVACELGLTSDKVALYNNLSLETVPAHKIYTENMGWLSQVKARYDPTDVMGRAGCHRIPLPGQTATKDKDSSDSQSLA